MLPNSDHLPSGFSQFGNGGPIPISVALNFSTPIEDIGRWNSFASRATMPETSISKYYETLQREDKVRVSRQIGFTNFPTSYASTNEVCS
jgi:hypothetical protein